MTDKHVLNILLAKKRSLKVLLENAKRDQHHDKITPIQQEISNCNARITDLLNERM